MKSELYNLDIVLISSNFNPFIVTKDWLISKKIFEEEPTEFINSGAYSFFETKEYSFVLDNSKLILTSKVPSVENLKIFEKKIDTFISTLPETPYKYIGLNIIYVMVGSSSEEKPTEILKKKYCNNLKNVETIFEASDLKTGLIFIYDINNIQCNVQIAPNWTNNNLQIHFNFNLNVTNSTSEDKIKLMKEFISLLNDYFVKSKRILENFFELKD